MGWLTKNKEAKRKQKGTADKPVNARQLLELGLRFIRG